MQTSRFYGGLNDVALNVQPVYYDKQVVASGPTIKRKFKSCGASAADPAAVIEESWVDSGTGIIEPMTRILEDSYNWKFKEAAQALPMTDMFKYSSKNKSYALDPKSAVNFTRTAGTATSYTASTVKT